MFALLLTVTGALPVNAGSNQHGKGRAILLPVTSQWYEGTADHQHGSALSRQGTFGNDNRSVYLMELAPGTDFTLGMRYPAVSHQKPHVALFDRWPGEAGAKRYKLPMGPALKTNYEKIEYRWRFAVSPRSEGSLAFLVVDSRQSFSGKEGPFRYSLYLTTPSISPMKQMGEGITYLRGPSDLMLPGQIDAALYSVEYPYSRKGMGRRDREGELIRNGDFRRGLKSWKTVSSGTKSDAGGQVSVGNDGLRLSNVGPDEFAGVRQSIKRYVRDALSLLFTSELRFDRPASRDLEKNDESPNLQISICYVDEKGVERCGKKAFRTNFIITDRRSESSQSIEVENGRWYRFEEELMNFDPRPEVIVSVSIVAVGLKDSEAWIDSISLVVR